MRETRIENAKITGTTLGTEDHGIFTAYVHCSGPGWGCGFGGYALDQWNEAKQERIGTAYGLEFIKRILSTVGVENWEQLKGQHIRVETEGLGGGIRRIGHLLEDKWFDPKQLAAEFTEEPTVSR